MRKNDKDPEGQTPSHQITSQFPQVNAFPQTQYPPVNAFPQAKPPPSSSLAPAEKVQGVANRCDAAERLKAAVGKYIVANEKTSSSGTDLSSVKKKVVAPLTTKILIKKYVN